jgi:hypothetical protein
MVAQPSVEHGKVFIASLNRIRLDRIEYSYTCGPVDLPFTE